MSCGTNRYSRKKRDLQGFLDLLHKLDDQEVEELMDGLDNDKRIIGGTASRKGEWPWIVHLRFFPESTKSGSYMQVYIQLSY